MIGTWEERAVYMRALNHLRDETRREADRAQVGEPIPEHDPLMEAVQQVLAARKPA